MKKFIAFLFFLIIGTASAEIKVENDQLLVPIWSATGVIVAPEALKYLPEVQEAFGDPGRIIITKKKEVRKIVGLFHYKMDILAKEGVKYDGEKKIDLVPMDEVLKTEVQFFSFLLVIIVSVTAFSFAINSKGKASFVALVTTFVAVFVAAPAAPLIAIFVLALAALVSVAAWDIWDIKCVIPKFLVVLYFVLLVFSVGITYYPLF